MQALHGPARQRSGAGTCPDPRSPYDSEPIPDSPSRETGTAQEHSENVKLVKTSFKVLRTLHNC